MGDYLNFELMITALEGGLFRAQVAEHPTLDDDARPEHLFSLPYDDATLQRIMLILSGLRQPKNTTPEAVARQFGEALFRAVFQQDVLAAYQSAYRAADARNVGLRVRLDLNRAGPLATLPWEFLRDPDSDYLALSRSTPLVRYTKRFVSFSRVSHSLPLRILVMISAPKDLPPVDEARERANLEQATARLRERGLVEIEYLEDASLRTLQRVFRERDFHVFHYIGHGHFDIQNGVGALALEDPYTHENAVLVRGEALARELHEERGIRLVVLNACEGAAGDTPGPLQRRGLQHGSARHSRSDCTAIRNQRRSRHRLF
ncbi:MAG: CHAT domain-containing protein [Anaerolineae bacterium]|nr:CHAT domain-containing protein [Anaerolineae bacterium]